MIRTATQLKAKVRNLSGGDNKKAQTLIRNFIMERFLERIARESGLCWKPRSIKCGRRSRWISPPGMSLLQEQSNIPIT